MISVLVPYRPDGGERDRAWEWVRARWETLMPECELVVESPGPGADPSEFNHPAAINAAARRASGDVFVVADADTTFDHPALILEAAGMVETGRAFWVLPRFYDKLTEAASRALLAQNPAYALTYAAAEAAAVEWRGDSCSVSGIVVVPRDGFERVGGYDERFEFWGADDVCFSCAMDTLWGWRTRISGAAVHFWHPAPMRETYGHSRHPEQDRIMRAYTAAAGNPSAMGRLVERRAP